jgi:hypothetical protein
VTRLAFVDRLSGRHVQGGKKPRCSMPLVVVRHHPGTTVLQRQSGLRAVKRLDLTLLVEGEHDGVRGGFQIHADHVVDLLALRMRQPLARLWRTSAARERCEGPHSCTDGLVCSVCPCVSRSNEPQGRTRGATFSRIGLAFSAPSRCASVAGFAQNEMRDHHATRRHGSKAIFDSSEVPL